MTFSASTLASAAFAAGALAQVVYLTWGHWTRRHVVGLGVILPVAWFFAVMEMGPGPATFVVTAAMVLATATAFRHAIIPTSGAHTLFISTLPLWAILLEADWKAPTTLMLAAALAIATLFVVLIILKRDLPRPLRITATVYAILQLVLLVGIQFRIRFIDFFFGGPPPTVPEAALGGLLFAFLAAHLVQIYSILAAPATPTADKGSSEARTVHLDLLASRYQSTALDPRLAALLVLLFVTYWGLGRVALHLEPVILLWPWLAGASVLLRRGRSTP